MNKHTPYPAPGDPSSEFLMPTAAAAIGSGEDATARADLRNMWSIVYRNRWLILVMVALALAAGLVVTILTTRVYRAISTVQIEQQTPKILESDDMERAVSAQSEERFLQTQLDVLRSRALRLGIVADLRLARNTDFITSMGEKPAETAQRGLSLQETRRAQIVSILGRNVDVSLPRNSRIAQISFSSPDPELAATVSNAFARNYIQFNLQKKFDSSAYARNFLDSRLREAKTRLEVSERSLITYARSAQLIDTSNGATSTGAEGSTSGSRSLTTSNLVDSNNAVSQAIAARVSAQQRWQQAQSTPIMSLPEVLSNGTIQQLSQRRAELRANYDLELERRKPEFPTMVQAKAQLDELDRQIASLANVVRNSLRNQYETAQRQEDALNQRLSSLKEDTLNEQDRGVQYTILRREADTNRALYDGLLQRYKELTAAAGLLSNNITIIDLAERPTTPYAPRLAVNLAIAAFLGLILAAMTAFIREKVVDVIRTPADVSEKLGVPFLNSIPVAQNAATVEVALKDHRSPVSEAYYSLRTSIQLATSNRNHQVLLFASTRPAEGKSTSAFAVAQDFGRINKRVLLIDGDLRKPSLHRVLGLSSATGFANILAGMSRLEEVIVTTDFPNLDFIPCGPMPPNPAELLSGANLTAVLQEARQAYDLVVIDGPPLLGLADAVLLAINADSVVFVCEARMTKTNQIRTAISRLQGAGARILGVALTKFDVKESGYGDEYGYSYSYGHNARK